MAQPGQMSLKKIEQLLKMWASGKHTKKALAVKFGVSPTTIGYHLKKAA